MKRYYLVHDKDMPTIKEPFPGMNYIDLASHGPAGHLWNLVCLDFSHVEPKEGWQPFPSLLDAKTTLAASAVDHTTLADIGLTGDETALEAAVALGAIMPSMGPQ